MEYSLQTTRMLHDEHMEEVARLERLEGLLQRRGPTSPRPKPSAWQQISSASLWRLRWVSFLESCSPSIR